MVRFLISWEPESDDRRAAPSVKKAHFYLGIKRGYGWQKLSWRTFNEIWVQNKSVGHFMYVNEYNFNRKLLLDPTKKTFHGQVRELLADREGIENFLREALFVHNRLKQVLYRTTWTGVFVAEFPMGLQALPVRLREVDEKMRSIMREYER